MEVGGLASQTSVQCSSIHIAFIWRHVPFKDQKGYAFPISARFYGPSLGTILEGVERLCARLYNIMWDIQM